MSVWKLPVSHRGTGHGTMGNLNQLPVVPLHFITRSSGARTRASSVVSSRQRLLPRQSRIAADTPTLQTAVTQCNRFAVQILVFARLMSMASPDSVQIQLRQAITQVRGLHLKRRRSANRRQPAPSVINPGRCGALIPSGLHVKCGHAFTARLGEHRLCQGQK